MTPRAQSRLGVRPFLPQDAAGLIDIFRLSVEELTADDYDDAQRAAWASVADDEEAFATRLKERLTLIGSLDGAVVGFAALHGSEAIDMLYVHPAAAGQGVGSMLLDALERLAASRGARKLAVDASDNAQPFFRKHGYVPRQRNSVPLAGEWLANTTMDKTLAPTRSAS